MQKGIANRTVRLQTKQNQEMSLENKISQLTYRQLLSVSSVVDSCTLLQANHETEKLNGKAQVIAQEIMQSRRHSPSLVGYRRLINRRISELNARKTKNIDVSHELDELRASEANIK